MSDVKKAEIIKSEPLTSELSQMKVSKIEQTPPKSEDLKAVKEQSCKKIIKEQKKEDQDFKEEEFLKIDQKIEIVKQKSCQIKQDSLSLSNIKKSHSKVENSQNNVNDSWKNPKSEYIKSDQEKAVEKHNKNIDLQKLKSIEIGRDVFV